MANLNSTIINGNLKIFKNINLKGKNIIDLIYPIGSIYITINNIDPKYLFGGNWTKIEGRFLLGSSSTKGIGATGGSWTTTISDINIKNHNHYFTPEATAVSGTSLTQSASGIASSVTSLVGSNTSGSYTPIISWSATEFTSSEDGKHSHQYYSLGYDGTYGTRWGWIQRRPKSGNDSSYSCSDKERPFSSTNVANHNHESNATTATLNGNHTHSISLSANILNDNNSISYSNTSSNTEYSSNNSNTSVTIDVTNPYIYVYIWKRIA